MEQSKNYSFKISQKIWDAVLTKAEEGGFTSRSDLLRPLVKAVVSGRISRPAATWTANAESVNEQHRGNIRLHASVWTDPVTGKTLHPYGSTKEGVKERMKLIRDLCYAVVKGHVGVTIVENDVDG